MLIHAPFRLAIGIPGVGESLIILAIFMLLFGAKKLPGLARSMGSSITQFKQGLREAGDELKSGNDSDKDEEHA